MFPVSGAEQLKNSDAHTLWPISAARCAYSRLLRPGPCRSAPSAPAGALILSSSRESAGSHRFHSPARFASALRRSVSGETLHRASEAACASSAASAGNACSAMNRRRRCSSAAARGDGSRPEAPKGAGGADAVVPELLATARGTPPGTHPATDNARVASVSTSVPAACAFAALAFPAAARARTPARIAAPRNSDIAT